MKPGDIVVPPGRFELTEDDIAELPILDLSEFEQSEAERIEESIPIHPGRAHAAEPTLADLGIHNRAAARSVGLRNPKRPRSMAVPSKHARHKTRRSV